MRPASCDVDANLVCASLGCARGAAALGPEEFWEFKSSHILTNSHSLWEVENCMYFVQQCRNRNKYELGL